MLTLSLLRHAKSGWDDPGLMDHERTLTNRGIKAAKRMGRYIAEQPELVPHLILCSDAVRARATLELLLTEHPRPIPEVTTTATLYHATPEAILQVITREAGAMWHVMVIGHNPGLQDLALMLCDDAQSPDKPVIARKFPTAALAHIKLPGNSWGAVTAGSGALQCFVKPRQLPE